MSSSRLCAFCRKSLPEGVDIYCPPALVFIHEECEAPMVAVMRLRRSTLNQLGGVTLCRDGTVRLVNG